MWTDEELAKIEEIWSEADVPSMREVYRLARLGLAAEQVGPERMAALADLTMSPDTDPMSNLANHPAWRKS